MQVSLFTFDKLTNNFVSPSVGLDKYDVDSDRPIAYTHLDIAAAAANYPDFPNYAAVNAINYKYFYESK